MPEIRIEKREPIPIAYLRHVGPYSDQAGIQATFERMMEWAGAHGLIGPGFRLFGIAHDPPDAPPEGLRYDIAVTVPDGTSGDGDVRVATIPGGEWAVATHVGPYEDLGETYSAVSEWIQAQALTFGDAAPIEEYLDGPEVPEERRRTLVAFKLG